jgi:hypothetical protein
MDDSDPLDSCIWNEGTLVAAGHGAEPPLSMFVEDEAAACALPAMVTLLPSGLLLE